MSDRSGSAPTSVDCSTGNLLEKYGDRLGSHTFSDEEAEAFLATLFSVMQCFADLAFMPKAGDKSAANAALDIEDVLNWTILRETAPETVASLKTESEQEQP